LLGRRYRRSDEPPPRWFVVVDTTVFLAWAGLSLFFGALQATSPTGIFLLVFGAVIALVAVSAPRLRYRDRALHHRDP
jgi:hypothetical protein